jgi:hypothetical protein
MESQMFMVLLIGFGVCVAVPLGIVGAILYLVTKRARDRHAERMAMIERGLVPPADGSVPPPPRAPEEVVARAAVSYRPSPADHAKSIGWAVGLAVAGVLFLVSELADLNGFGIVLTGIGAAYLTRGILGLRRERREPEGEGR